ncbi:MAG: hypothetical protein LBQ74_12905 [Prevotella sp.]|jgi:hypothetical protein|nr:hypothetical protein [Prevotella sp.]
MKVLDLIIKKKFAREISAGTKVREYRSCNDFYLKRICNIKNGKTIGFKEFDNIRLHDYNNSFEVITKVDKIVIVEIDNWWIENMSHEIEAEKGTDIIVIELGDIVSIRGL